MAESSDEVERLTAQRDACLAVCDKLVEEQEYYAKHTWQPDCMPGNEWYSDKFMVVVCMARAARAECYGKGPAPPSQAPGDDDETGSE